MTTTYGRATALNQHAIDRHALLVRDEGPCVSGQTVTLKYFSPRPTTIKVAVSGLDAEGVAQTFTVDLAALKLPRLPLSCAQDPRDPDAVHVEVFRLAALAAWAGQVTDTNLGGQVHVAIRDDDYTVIIRDYASSSVISSRRSFGGLTQLHISSTPAQHAELVAAWQSCRASH